MIIFPSYLSFILYNPIRKILTNRKKVIDDSGINTSSVVLEIGAGNGFITEVIAHRAKIVYASELQPCMVKKLRKRMEILGDKVNILAGDMLNYDFEKEFADAAILFYSFHEIRNKTDASKIIGNAIKKGGIISIYEPTIEVGKISMNKTINMFESIGFEKEIERKGVFTRFVRLRKTAGK